MKKNLLYLCTLVCMVGLFATSCESSTTEEEENRWESLPSGQIAAENVAINLNGQATSGNIVFKALNATSAQMELKNVVDGYGEINLDVAMQGQTDGSFTLNATKDIQGKPSARAEAAMLNVSMNGKVAADGKFELTLMAEGPGLFIGTYSDDNLVLTYSGEKLTGYEVVFDGTKGDNVTITMKNIIPGEAETLLENIEYKSGAFSGKTNTDHAAVEFAGSRVDKVLTLDLKVKMNDPASWVGTYGLSDYTLGDWDYLGSPMTNWALGGALYSNWTYHEDMENPDNDPSYSQVVAGLLRGVGGILLPQMLKDITIQADGNIVATYVETPAIKMDMTWIMGAMFGTGFPTKEMLGADWIPSTGWVSSPKQLAKWFEKDGRFYLKLDIKNIIATAAPDIDADMADMILGMLATSTPTSIKELVAGLGFDLSEVTDATIAQLLSWVNDGIPMVVEKKEGARTCLSLDKAAFDNLFTARPGDGDGNGDLYEDEQTADLLVIWNMLAKAGIIPADAALASIMLEFFPAYWSVTDSFNLGLDMQKQ